jgi:hypothetical protein
MTKDNTSVSDATFPPPHRSAALAYNHAAEKEMGFVAAFSLRTVKRSRQLPRLVAGCPAPSAVGAVCAAGLMENDARRAEFSPGGLASVTDKASAKTVRLASDGFAVFAGNESLEGDFLTPGAEPTHGLFLALQNPFLQLKRRQQRLSLAYPPDLSWNPTNGAFVSDRLLPGPYALSGVRSPARLVPEWKLVAKAGRPGEAWIDRAEVDALVEGVRAFLLWRPRRVQGR